MDAAEAIHMEARIQNTHLIFFNGSKIEIIMGNDKHIAQKVYSSDGDSCQVTAVADDGQVHFTDGILFSIFCSFSIIFISSSSLNPKSLQIQILKTQSLN